MKQNKINYNKELKEIKEKEIIKDPHRVKLLNLRNGEEDFMSRCGIIENRLKKMGCDVSVGTFKDTQEELRANYDNWSKWDMCLLVFQYDLMHTAWKEKYQRLKDKKHYEREDWEKNKKKVEEELDKDKKHRDKMFLQLMNIEKETKQKQKDIVYLEKHHKILKNSTTPKQFKNHLEYIIRDLSVVTLTTYERDLWVYQLVNIMKFVATDYKDLFVTNIKNIPVFMKKVKIVHSEINSFIKNCGREFFLFEPELINVLSHIKDIDRLELSKHGKSLSVEPKEDDEELL